MGRANWTDIGGEQNLQEFSGKRKMGAQESRVIPRPGAE